MTFLSFGRDGAVQKKSQADQCSSPSWAMHSPGGGPGCLSGSLSGSSPHTQILSPHITLGCLPPYPWGLCPMYYEWHWPHQLLDPQAIPNRDCLFKSPLCPASACGHGHGCLGHGGGWLHVRCFAVLVMELLPSTAGLTGVHILALLPARPSHASCSFIYTQSYSCSYRSVPCIAIYL